MLEGTFSLVACTQGTAQLLLTEDKHTCRENLDVKTLEKLNQSHHRVLPITSAEDPCALAVLWSRQGKSLI